MRVLRRTTEERVKKEYETIDLKAGVQVERCTIKTYVKDELIEEKVSSYYKNNKVDQAEIVLFGKEVRELHRQQDIFQTVDRGVHEIVYRYINSVPFEELIESGDNWEEKFDLLVYKPYNHKLLGLEGEELPKRMYFDYMQGIREGLFDLAGLLKHLNRLGSVEVLRGGIAA